MCTSVFNQLTTAYRSMYADNPWTRAWGAQLYRESLAEIHKVLYGREFNRAMVKVIARRMKKGG